MDEPGSLYVAAQLRKMAADTVAGTAANPDATLCGIAAKEIERLHGALQKVMDTDCNMGGYPAAVSGYGDERDYKQRDGYKNGWNAAVREYGSAIAACAYAVGILPTPDPDDQV